MGGTQCASSKARGGAAGAVVSHAGARTLAQKAAQQIGPQGADGASGPWPQRPDEGGRSAPQSGRPRAASRVSGRSAWRHTQWDTGLGLSLASQLVISGGPVGAVLAVGPIVLSMVPGSGKAGHPGAGPSTRRWGRRSSTQWSNDVGASIVVVVGLVMAVAAFEVAAVVAAIEPTRVLKSGELANHQATIRGVAAKGAPTCTHTANRVVSKR